MKKNITTTETTAVVRFNFGSVATVGVTLYEGLSIDECIALRSEDIEEYKIACGEWTTRKATADEARQHLEALRNEEETESTEGGEETAPAFTITKNDQFNSVEVSFSGKPSAEVRDALKALRFRWHGVKRVWYGYATEEAVRAAIEGQGSEKTANSTEAAPKASKPGKGMPQDHIRIYWNGIKIDGGKLIRCFYSLDNNAENAPSVSISARDYDHLPRDLFEVRNDTDIYTDYFDNDSTYITPEHPLYKYFRYAAAKAKIRELKAAIAYDDKELSGSERWPGRFEYVRQERERAAAKLAELEAMTDPGQPTAEDLEQIDRQRQEAENARKAAEHEAELRERERVLAERHAGFEYINTVAAKYPIKDGEPVVYIPFSENPAFYSFMVADTTKTTLHPDGTTTEEVLHKMPRCVLSVTAAEIVLRHFDEIEAAKGCGYDKTDFIIKWTDESSEPCEYSGRYDLGDNDGGMIQHIRNFGEWNRTHSPFGQPIENPEESNETIRFADYLAGIIESEEEREECEVVTLAPADAGCVWDENGDEVEPEDEDLDDCNEYMHHIFYEIG